MVSYSFRPQFIGPIVALSKCQTLRNDRKRHARPGETLQLYTGMRTRACRLIGTAICGSADRIRLDFRRGRVDLPDRDMSFDTEASLRAFAFIDGFASWAHLTAFWREEHPDIDDAWEGVRISWGPSFKAPEA